MSRSYLLVIGDAAPLAWVLEAHRMAFPERRRSQAATLEIGDELAVHLYGPWLLPQSDT